MTGNTKYTTEVEMLQRYLRKRLEPHLELHSWIYERNEKEVKQEGIVYED